MHKHQEIGPSALAFHEPALAHGRSQGHAARRTAAGAEHAAGCAGLTMAWARQPHEVREAQRLRWKVFAEELGARIATPSPGFDIDIFDPYCDHLLVRSAEGLLVGTYRVLPPHQAQRVGGLYSETEFDITRLVHLRPRLLELGRSCVHQGYRSGAVIMALWAGLAHYMQSNGLDAMIGCASVSMRDGGHYAASLWARLRKTHLAAVEDHMQPRLPLPVGSLRQDLPAEAPPLLKGYLRVGARICGAPAWDPDFNTADFPLLMRLADVNPRYARHFLSAAEA
ncbi:MAG: GNAT family N-acetyltransferase [Thiomonas sp.]